MARALELALARIEPGVAARAASRGDVPDMDDEGQVLAVQFVDQRVQLQHFDPVVRRVADQGEGEALIGTGLGRCRARREQQRGQ
jgi:hypothetical protein